jgi:hypothetical protein
MEFQRRGADEVTEDDDMGSSEDGQNGFGGAADGKVCFRSTARFRSTNFGSKMKKTSRMLFLR